jgi:8-oxo-dGTP pyrophosphatase MutT (NUDIX family)
MGEHSIVAVSRLKPKPWQVLDERRLHACRVFDVHEIAARSPRMGKDHTFYGIEAPAWVKVVPISDAGEVVMVHEYRHGLKDIALETPGGMVDPGETAAAAGARELLEETGYQARELVDIGSINPNPAPGVRFPCPLSFSRIRRRTHARARLWTSNRSRWRRSRHGWARLRGARATLKMPRHGVRWYSARKGSTTRRSWCRRPCSMRRRALAQA